MFNDPELNGKYLGSITQDFVKVTDIIKEASHQLITRKISSHPIFPISQVELPIGKLLLGKYELNLEWNYYISFLDEFVQRNLIDVEKVNDFYAAYKDPDEFCCLFVVDHSFTNFLFVPYPED